MPKKQKKGNANKRKARPPPPPRRRSGKAKPKRSGVRSRPSDPFVACVYGPVGMAGGGTGVPDGSSFKTVVIEHRSLVTIKPDALGQIGFAVLSNPYGGIAWNRGDATWNTFELYQNPYPGGSTRREYPTQVAGSTILRLSDATRGVFTPDYAICPFNEWRFDSSGYVSNDQANGTNILTGPANEHGLRITKWRTITTVARVSYIGSSLHNSGVMAIARSPGGVGSRYDIKVLIGADAAMTEGQLEDCVLAQAAGAVPVTFDAVAAMPGAKVIPVRCGSDVLSPPSDFVWHEWEDAFFLGPNDVVPKTGFANIGGGGGPISFDDADQSASLDNLAFAVGAAWRGPPSNDGPMFVVGAPLPGWSNNDVSYVQIQGMESQQSVMVELRTCCEYVLAFNSPAARFAKDSPRPRPAAMKAVLDIARKVPASKPPDDGVSWISTAINTGRDVLAGPVGQTIRDLAKLAIGSFAPSSLALLG